MKQKEGRTSKPCIDTLPEDGREAVVTSVNVTGKVTTPNF